MVFFLGFLNPSFASIDAESYQKAMDLFNEGDYDGSIAVLKAALDEDPNQAAIYNLLGTIYLQQNRSIQSAIGSFEQALRIDSGLDAVAVKSMPVRSRPRTRTCLPAGSKV